MQRDTPVRKNCFLLGFSEMSPDVGFFFFVRYLIQNFLKREEKIKPLVEIFGLKIK